MNEVEEILLEAERAFEAEKFKKGHSLLAPLIEKEVPEAFFLAAGFGKKGEKDEIFFQRRFYFLNQAAHYGHASALYTLAVHHDTGVECMKSGEIAAVYFEKAANLGHGRAKLFHGMNLVQGINKISKDKERGLDYIRQAVADNVEDAAKILEQILAGEWY
jgi:TPR repeat protein